MANRSAALPPNSTYALPSERGGGEGATNGRNGALFFLRDVVLFQQHLHDAGEFLALVGESVQLGPDGGGELALRPAVRLVQAGGEAGESVAQRTADEVQGGAVGVALIDFLTEDGDVRRRIDAETDLSALDRQHLDGGADAGNQQFFIQASREHEHGRRILS